MKQFTARPVLPLRITVQAHSPSTPVKMYDATLIQANYHLH